ncbi:MAG TPA: PH domain-containing protein [Phycisphaerae bacterium]|nr:PH domain-containing protein [Phycisphaerae bacterium]
MANEQNSDSAANRTPSRHDGNDDQPPHSPRQPDATPSPTGAQSPATGPGQRPNRAAAPDEEVLWSGRTSWKHFAGLIAAWSAGSVLLAALMGWMAAKWEALSGRTAFGIVLIVILCLGAYIACRVLRAVLAQRYRLTSERLFIDRGILSRTIDQTELIRVDDVRVHKSLVGMILGVGSVEVLSTDVSDRTIRIEGVQQSEEVAETIRNCVRTLRKRSLFVESL